MWLLAPLLRTLWLHCRWLAPTLCNGCSSQASFIYAVQQAVHFTAWVAKSCKHWVGCTQTETSVHGAILWTLGHPHPISNHWAWSAGSPTRFPLHQCLLWPARAGGWCQLTHGGPWCSTMPTHGHGWQAPIARGVQHCHQARGNPMHTWHCPCKTCKAWPHPLPCTHKESGAPAWTPKVGGHTQCHPTNTVSTAACKG